MWGRAGCWGCCHMGAWDMGQLICLPCVLCHLALVYSKSALPAAPSLWLCWEQSCRHRGHWQSPQRCWWWWWCRSRATTVRSHSHAQPHASPLPPLGTGGWRVFPPARARHCCAAPGGTSQESLAHVSTVCQGQVCFFMPSSWGQHQRHSGETGAASPTLPQTNFVKIFVKKKQKDLGVSRTGDTAPDTIPRWEQRRCRGSGTCQAVCEGQSPSLVHWGPQGWGREAAH